jgi:phage-related protein
MGSLMQGSGLDTQKAMDLSGQAMQRAADVASIMGIDINSAMESIAGAAKGNFTMMDNLGVAMNATTIEAYALSKGIKTSYNEMTNAQKVELAMEMFLEKSAYATGNYVKENQTFAGSFTTLKASIQNFLSGAGDIESVIDSVMDFGEILVKSIGEMAPRIVDGIIKLINGIIPQLPPLLDKLLPVVIKGAVNLVNGVINSLPTLLPILIQAVIDVFTEIVKILPQITHSLIDGVLLIINEIAKQLPTLIPLIIDTILKMYESVIDNIDLFIDAAIELIIGLTEGLIEALPILIEKVPLIIEKLVTKLTDPEMLGKLVQAAARLITELAIGLIKAIPGLLINVGKVGMAIIKGLNNLNTTVGEIGKNVVKGIWTGISNSLSWIKSKISGWVGNVLKFIKKLFGIHSPSTVNLLPL